MPAHEQGIHPERYQLIPRVLVFITNGEDVLLIKGAPTKRIWANKYNGVGGHVERGEDIYSAAKREVFEETGLTAQNFRFRGVITIDAGQPTGIGMFIFTASTSDRKTIDSAEGNLEWVSTHEIAKLELVEDLPTILPRVLKQPADSVPFFGRYWYDADNHLKIEIVEPE